MPQFKCKNCGKTYNVSEKEYLDLKLKVLFRAKLAGLGNMELSMFMNLNSRCCRTPDYEELDTPMRYK